MCQVCHAARLVAWLDCGDQPLANALRSPREAPLRRYPLIVSRCLRCGHVQLRDPVPPEVLYDRYPYRSGVSETFRRHCAGLAQYGCASVWGRVGAKRLYLLDIGGNDGSLLMECLRRSADVIAAAVSVDPAVACRDRHYVMTVQATFPCALPHATYDLIFTQNTLNAVYDLDAFVTAIRPCLAPGGVWIVEVPYVVDLLQDLRIDTVYHEHAHYWAVHPFKHLVETHGLALQDVSLEPMHGRTLRLTVGHPGGDVRGTVDTFCWWEDVARLREADLFERCVTRLEHLKDAWWTFYREHPGRWAGYGASAKVTTLCAFLGLDDRHLAYVVDDTPEKQGHLSAAGFPIVSRHYLKAEPVNYLLCFPWNVAQEIRDHLRRDGIATPLAVAIPEPRFV